MTLEKDFEDIKLVFDDELREIKLYGKGRNDIFGRIISVYDADDKENALLVIKDIYSDMPEYTTKEVFDDPKILMEELKSLEKIAHN
ncbi:MAG: hypothetical protein HUJ68_09950 [Clostridia bacterium]|nr:hypothetical protein [Clostridia bacterium]